MADISWSMRGSMAAESCGDLGFSITLMATEVVLVLLAVVVVVTDWAW